MIFDFFLGVLRLPTQSYYFPRNICMFDKKDCLQFYKLYQFNSRSLDFVFLIFYILSQQLRSNQLVVISSSISTLLCSFTWFWQNRPWERSLISIIYSTLVCLSCVQIAFFIDNKNVYLTTMSSIINMKSETIYIHEK